MDPQRRLKLISFPFRSQKAFFIYVFILLLCFSLLILELLFAYFRTIRTNSLSTLMSGVERYTYTEIYLYTCHHPGWIVRPSHEVIYATPPFTITSSVQSNTNATWENKSSSCNMSFCVSKFHKKRTERKESFIELYCIIIIVITHCMCLWFPDLISLLIPFHTLRSKMWCNWMKTLWEIKSLEKDFTDKFTFSLPLCICNYWKAQLTLPPRLFFKLQTVVMGRNLRAFFIYCHSLSLRPSVCPIYTCVLTIATTTTHFFT